MRFLIIILFAISSSLSAQNYNMALRSTVTYPGQTIANIAGYWQDGKEYALVGASQGLGIVDITNPDAPVKITQIPGPNNLWKEIKTYQNYAYIVSEGGQGVQIVNLSNLPTDNLDAHYYRGTGALNNQLNRIHALHIDTTAGFLYCFGGGQQVATIHDLNTDPYNPTYVSQYAAGGYIHDGYVDNDTLYACHIYDGLFAMVDMRDKQNPQVLGSKTTPNNFTHNVWLLPSRKHVLTTDERANSWLASYDVSDPTDIVELDRMQTTPGSGSVVHNTHVMEHIAVNSWYTDGINAVDAWRPQNLVQIGAYDTWAGSGSGFDGCWGAYPFFPSKTIIASNINPGELFVITPNYMDACYVEGVVRDGCTGQRLNNVSITINSNDPLTATTTDNDGIFRTGQPTPGQFVVSVSRSGYVTQTFDVTLQPHGIIDLNVNLLKPSNYVTLPNFTVCTGETVTVCGQDFSGAGPHAAMCMDMMGCDSIIQFEIIEQGPTADISGLSALTCSEPSLTLTGNTTPSTWYLAGSTTPIGQSNTLTVTAPGTYVLEVNQNGCFGYDSIVVEDFTTLPTVSASVNDNIDCTNSEVQLFANTNSTTSDFEWVGPNGFASQNMSPTVNQSGPYTLIVTNEYDCSASTIVEVIADLNAPTANIPPVVLYCSLPSTTLVCDFNGANYGFSWYNGIGDSYITVNTPGDYDLTVTDLDNGCTTVLTGTVTADFQVPDVNATASGQVDCSTSAVTLTANSMTSNLQYAWSTGVNTPTTTTNAAGTYTVTVTSAANGCSNEAIVTVDSNTDMPNVSIAPAGMLTCTNTSVDLVASGDPGLTYVWTDAQGNMTLGNTLEATNAGTYCVEATNQAGCSNVACTVIEANSDIPTLMVQGGTLDCNNATQTLTANASAGSLVSWMGPNGFNVNGTSTVTISIPGTYVITASGQNGCTSEETVEVVSDMEVPILTITETPINCANPTGTLTATASIQSDFLWNGPNGFTAVGSSVNVTEGGMYTLEAISTNGCSSSEIIMVNSDFEEPMLSVTDAVLDCNQTTATLTVATDIMNTVMWNGPNGFTSTEQTIMVDTEGDYTVLVTGVNGCPNMTIATVISNITEPSVQIPAIDQLTCCLAEVELPVPNEVGVDYTWFDAFGEVVVNNLASEVGLYFLAATDLTNGCMNNASDVVTSNFDAPSIIASGGIITCAMPTVQLTGAAPAVLDANFNWSGPMNFLSMDENPTVSEPGIYTLEVQDPYNCCMSSTTVEVLDSCLIGTQNLLLEAGDLTVYPNATKGQLNLQSNIANQMINTVKVYDQSGKLVFSTSIPPSANAKLDLSHLAEGAYQMQVFSDKKFWLKKVMRM